MDELMPINSGFDLEAFHQAEKTLLREAEGNPWFLNSYWPENRPRVLRMMRDAMLSSSQRPLRVFEPGCATGYIAKMAAAMGCEVTATDAWRLDWRDEEFRALGIRFFYSNMNELGPFANVPNDSFDVVLFGEVFEHILNHPEDLLRELHRVLAPGGMLILTTPNPSTLANAFRTLLDKHSIWGTDVFLTTPKFDPERGGIIDNGEIHYREYRQREIVDSLRKTGFEGIRATYVPAGVSPVQPFLKRLVKTAIAYLLPENRLFCGGHHITARKSAITPVAAS